MAKKTQLPENLTGVEVMTHTLLFCYNWTEEDFKKAFKDSKIGWEYQWNRLQNKCNNGWDSTAAIVDVILNMDRPHMEMLFNYIFTKSAHTIQSAREWNRAIDEQTKS